MEKHLSHGGPGNDLGNCGNAAAIIKSDPDAVSTEF